MEENHPAVASVCRFIASLDFVCGDKLAWYPQHHAGDFLRQDFYFFFLLTTLTVCNLAKQVVQRYIMEYRLEQCLEIDKSLREIGWL